MIGDIVHNLRSALDLLVWALTLANQPEPPPNPIPDKGPGSKWKDVSFPIYSEDRRKRDGNGKRIPWQAAPPRSLWGIEPSLRAEFEELQPFMRKENPAYVHFGSFPRPKHLVDPAAGYPHAVPIPGLIRLLVRKDKVSSTTE